MLRKMIRRSGISADQHTRTPSKWIDRLTELDASVLALLEANLGRITHCMSTPSQIPAQELLAKELVQAEAHQTQVIQEIQGLLADRQQADRLQRDLAQLSSIQSEQESLLTETSHLVGMTVSETLGPISATLRNQLESLSDRQLELAQRTEQIVAGPAVPPTAIQDDPFARLFASRQLARKSGVTAQMRRAVEELRANRLGNATQQQQDANRVLCQMVDLLLGAPPAGSPHETPAAASNHRDRETSSPANQASTTSESTLSEIARLIQLQRELNLRTQQLSRDRSVAQDPGVQNAQELHDLA